MSVIPSWTIGVGANLIIAGCYVAICWHIFGGLLRSGELRANRLATATALIFFTCAVHHGGDALHALMPLFGTDASGLADRHGYTWQMDVWDLFGAAVAAMYLSLRSSYGQLLSTPAMFQDLTRERVATAVAEERAALTEAQAIAGVGSWTWELPNGAIGASPEYLRLLETTLEEMRRDRHLDHIHPEDRARVIAARDALITAGTDMDETFRVGCSDGPVTILRARGRVEEFENGARRATGTVQDITDLVLADQARRQAEERFRVAFAQAGVPTAILSLEPGRRGRLLDANAAYAELLGTTLEELVGADLRHFIHPEDLRLAFERPLERLAEDDRTPRLQFERRFLRAGEIISTLITDAPITGPDGRQAIIEQAIDISARKRFEGELRHLADHDPLSGLFNRRRFSEELEQTLALSRRYGSTGAVLMIDLDGFKFVNDIFGHAAGDALVTRLASRLKRGVRLTDVVARSGGDEFAVILRDVDEIAAAAVAEKLLQEVRLGGTVIDGDRVAQVTASIGITLFGPGHDELPAEDLLVEADIAMYDAKGAGKDRLCVFRRGERRRELIAARHEWLHRLRSAIEGNQLMVWAQPIRPVVAGDGPIRHELLLRMLDGDGAPILPSGFLYNAERYGLIETIDVWVLEQAGALLDRCHRLDGPDLALSVNVSGQTLNSGKLPALLVDLLDRYTIPPGRLMLEITETAAISNMDLARELAETARRLGLQVAIDDFGTGFATFYYLKHLVFDVVKIDGEFIRRLPENEADQLVVQAVVSIARGVGAITIAEFVQDDATMALLERFGVDYAQGYHLGRPRPVEDMLAALEPAGG